MNTETRTGRRRHLSSFILHPSSFILLLLLAGCADTFQTWAENVTLPEQRQLPVRDPAALPGAPVPQLPPPVTVSDPQNPVKTPLSLDEAVRIALVNTKVVRILIGVTATFSGRTIYDAAITNTT